MTSKNPSLGGASLENRFPQEWQAFKSLEWHEFPWNPGWFNIPGSKNFMAYDIFPIKLGSIHPLYRAKNQGFGYCSSHLCTERVTWRCLVNVFLREHARWFTLCVYTPKREKLVVCRCSSQSLRESRLVHFLYSTFHFLYSTISVESVEGLDFFPEKYTDLPKTGHNRNLQTKMSIPRKTSWKPYWSIKSVGKSTW